MKIGILQQNYLVGDFLGNVQKIIDGYRKLVVQGAEIVLGSELAILGYPPKDLLEFTEVIHKQIEAFYFLTSHIGDVPLVIGLAEENPSVGKPLFNNAVVVQNNQVIARKSKELLPTYDVFDEQRYFERGPRQPCIFSYRGMRIGIIVCEDAWGGTENPNGLKLYPTDPVEDMMLANPDILLIPNASPYYWGKGDVRLQLIRNISKRLGRPVVYTNQVGGHDDLIFDGRSFAVNSDGLVVAMAKSFEEDLLIANTNSEIEYVYRNDVGQNSYSQLLHALVLGTRDYVRKTGFTKVVIGESGGIDSALTTYIAVEALGRENVTAIGMPSEFSSEGSVNHARQLCNTLGVKFLVVPIKDIYNSYASTLEPVIGWRDSSSDFGKDVTEENIQARARGMVLMAYSNRTGSLVLSTGNKSELAVGYCTLYGDMCGGLSVISDLPKTLVFGLARYINKTRGEIIPSVIIDKPPSAELRPNQKDQDSLPPYDVLDKILHFHVEMEMNSEAIVSSGFEKETVDWVLKKVAIAEYKRRQGALGLKVTTRAFGSGRHIPIAMKIKF